MIKAINSLSCHDFEETGNLSCTPKFFLHSETFPNVAVSLDVLSHVIQNHSRDILATLNHSDMFVRCALLSDRFANSTFHTYVSHWISYFGVPYSTAVGRGSNLASTVMHKDLCSLQSQLRPILTEASWSVGANERSHIFLHKSLDRLLLSPDSTVNQALPS